MTIGKRQSSVRRSIRAPKFLDKSSGFYGRLDEPETPAGEVELKVALNNTAVEDTDIFHEDDGQMLLRRKPSRSSSRWRSLRRKKSKEDSSPVSEEVPEVIIQVEIQTQEKERELGLVHFHIPQEADDQVLIRDKAVLGSEEQGSEEERGRREQEEGIKALKRKSNKNYCKALDRALRRGWESFITNLYSVTLTPETPESPTSDPGSSPSSPSTKKRVHSLFFVEGETAQTLAEMH